ncbi:MAG: hypothetical protein ACW99F_17170 [Candidatus Hodarchaeales archaeon]|jgi:hypothetical protein
MSTTIKIPMNEETRIALEDVFIEQDTMDARKFIFDALKNACQDAKRSTRNNVSPVNQRQEDGQMKQEEYKLKDVNLESYSLEDNPNWLPDNLSAEDNKPIELKLGDNTMKYLKIFGQLVNIRHEQYNIAEEKYLKVQKEEMRSKLPNDDAYEKWEKSQETLKESRLAAVPTSLQQALYVSIWPLIQQKIDMSDGLMFEKEFNELYPKDEDKKPQPLTK